MVALLRRHPNLYCDTASHRPRYFGVNGSGWEQFLQFGNTLLQDKIMVGLSWEAFGLPMEALIEEYTRAAIERASDRQVALQECAAFLPLGLIATGRPGVGHDGRRVAPFSAGYYAYRRAAFSVANGGALHRLPGVRAGKFAPEDHPHIGLRHVRRRCPIVMAGLARPSPRQRRNGWLGQARPQR